MAEKRARVDQSGFRTVVPARTFPGAGSTSGESDEGKSKIHRHKEAVNPRLTTACVIPVKDPIVSVLAWQRLPDRYAMNVAIDRVIVIGHTVNLVRPEMMSVSWPAARGLYPVGNGFSVRPIVMSLRAAGGQRKH
jgi:hypothetical protein